MLTYVERSDKRSTNQTSWRAVVLDEATKAGL